jgi:F1F0 ATPase subunit 2
MSEFPALLAAAGLGAGLVIGAGYFMLLYHAVRLHQSATPLARVVGIHILRAALAIAAFWWLAQLGAWPLLTGLLGFLVARGLARRLAEAPEHGR